MDMMEDVHDVAQGVGPEGTSKVGVSIISEELDSARSTNLVR